MWGCSCDPLLHTFILGYILSALRSARFCVGCSYGSLHLIFHIWPRLDGAHSCYLLITMDVKAPDGLLQKSVTLGEENLFLPSG